MNWWLVALSLTAALELAYCASCGNIAHQVTYTAQGAHCTDTISEPGPFYLGTQRSQVCLDPGGQRHYSFDETHGSWLSDVSGPLGSVVNNLAGPAAIGGALK